MEYVHENQLTSERDCMNAMEIETILHNLKCIQIENRLLIFQPVDIEWDLQMNKVIFISYLTHLFSSISKCFQFAMQFTHTRLSLSCLINKLCSKIIFLLFFPLSYSRFLFKKASEPDVFLKKCLILFAGTEEFKLYHINDFLNKVSKKLFEKENVVWKLSSLISKFAWHLERYSFVIK